MLSPISITTATLAVIAMLAMLLGCTPSPDGPAADVDHTATVEALLPNAAPALAPSAAATPTDTPASPTYTPRPQPTYTPRPAPTQAGDGELVAATPFRAQLLDGTEITLSDTFGTPTLLAFWAPW